MVIPSVNVEKINPDKTVLEKLNYDEIKLEFIPCVDGVESVMGVTTYIGWHWKHIRVRESIFSFYRGKNPAISIYGQQLSTFFFFLFLTFINTLSW